MLVDDDQTTLEVLSALLEAKNYRVFCRSEALGTAADLLRAMPQLVVLDLNMPGLSGGRLAQVLRTHVATKSLPIILYSAASEEALAEAAARVQPASFVRKAQGPRRLVAQIAAVLAKLPS